MNCRICNGELEVLGVLGKRQHLRCRSCGLGSSVPAPDDDEPDDDSRPAHAPFDNEAEGVDAGELTEWEINEERRR